MACLMQSTPAAAAAAVTAAASLQQPQQSFLWRHSSCPAAVGDVRSDSGCLYVPAQSVLGRHQSCPSRIGVQATERTERSLSTGLKREVEQTQSFPPLQPSPMPLLDQIAACLVVAMQLQMMFLSAIQQCPSLLFAVLDPPKTCAASLKGQCSQEVTCECTIAGLAEIIDVLGIQAYATRIYHWCEHEGAVFLDEIAECAEQLCDSIGLHTHQRHRMLAWAAEHCAAASVDTKETGWSCPSGHATWTRPRQTFETDCGTGTDAALRQGVASSLRRSCAAETEWHSNSATSHPSSSRRVHWASPLVSVIDSFEDEGQQGCDVQIEVAEDEVCDEPASRQTTSEPMPLKRTRTYGWRSLLSCVISPVGHPDAPHDFAASTENWTESEEEFEVPPCTQPEVAMMMPRRW